MSYVNAKSFAIAAPVNTPLMPSKFSPANVCARTALLAELDARMAVQVNAKCPGLTNCPEHLYSIDCDKLDAARRLNS